MDERKRNILIIAATTAAVVLMVVANIAFILMHPSGTENRNKLAASDVKAETSTSTPAARHQKPVTFSPACRGGGFLLKNPSGFSIDRLSPHALWFARFMSRATR